MEKHIRNIGINNFYIYGLMLCLWAMLNLWVMLILYANAKSMGHVKPMGNAKSMGHVKSMEDATILILDYFLKTYF